MGRLEGIRESKVLAQQTDYNTVGCTKDLMGRGKCLIIFDCVTENGPIPAALWTFLTESKVKRGNHMILNSL